MTQSMTSQSLKLLSLIRQAFLPYRSQVKRRAQGSLKYDYLVPAGPYKEQWDWDGFFIGMGLAADISSEAIYLRNWVLNYVGHADPKTGYIPGLLTPRGRDKRLDHIKPFLAQGAYFASQYLDDFNWVKPHLATIIKSLKFREKNRWSDRFQLGVWHNSMESGADNNIAVLDFPDDSIIGADLNSFIYREYQAISKIAKKLGKLATARKFSAKAARLKRQMNLHLWQDKGASYFNLDSLTGQPIIRHTYSNVIPLFAPIASPDQGKKMIQRHLLNPQEFWSKWGVRTLAKNDSRYNNQNIIKPHSNWQGPVWPLFNYLAMQSLQNYGFPQQARQLAINTVKLCLADISQTGGMHENYHAETGEPLAAPDFISWNLLIGEAIKQVNTNKNPWQIT